MLNRVEETAETLQVQRVVDKCSQWLKNRPYFSKRGDQRLITGGPLSFCPQDAPELKSKPLPAEIHRIPLTTATPSKPCSVCHPNPNHNGAVGETNDIITDRPGGGEG